MGAAITSLDFVPQDYKIKYIDSNNRNLREYNTDEFDTKGKTIKVMITQQNIQEITLPESDLTVGWLLSEVISRYLKGQEESEEQAQTIIGLKTVEHIPALDYYLTQLENSLSQIRDKMLVAHFSDKDNAWSNLPQAKV